MTVSCDAEAADSLDYLLDRLEQLMAGIEGLEDPVRGQGFELLDGIDALHRMAPGRLGQELGADTVERVRGSHPAIDWLFEAYAVGMDEPARADAALQSIRPYVHSHGR